MRKARLCLTILVLALWLPARFDGQTKTPKRSTPAQPATLSIKEIVQRESAGIVAIYNLDERGEVRGTGTGFIVMREGVIITNYHVVEGAHDAQVKLKNGEVFDRVRVMDYDKRRDIAVLQIRATGLPMVTLGDSATVEVTPLRAQWFRITSRKDGGKTTILVGVIITPKGGALFYGIVNPENEGQDRSPVVDMFASLSW